MASNETNPHDDHRLTDDELMDVVGGMGFWHYDLEVSYQEDYARWGKVGSIEDFLMVDADFDNPEEMLAARQAWLDKGRPRDVAYLYDNGKISKLSL